MYGRDDPEVGRVLDKIAETVNEMGGVGVIAGKGQEKDPRYSMSLTKDISPGETNRQLAKMGLGAKVTSLKEELATLKEKWSAKYKKSIDCNNPKGFSQKAHCAGKKK